MKVEVDLNEEEAFCFINTMQNDASLSAFEKTSRAIAKAFGLEYNNGQWIKHG